MEITTAKYDMCLLKGSCTLIKSQFGLPPNKLLIVGILPIKSIGKSLLLMLI